MYKFGNQPYELPTNTDMEKVLQKNLDNINPVEMKEKVVDGKKMLFPFWTPVKDASGISFTDYKKYLSGKEKRLDIMAKKDQVGIVQPKDETKTYEETNIIDKINSVIDRQKNAKVFDNSGVVKVIKNEMDATKTSKQVIDNKVGEPKEVKVEKSAKSKTGVGAVTPQADMGKQTSVDVTVPSSSQKTTPTTKTQITDNRVGEPKEAKVEKSAKSKTGVGAVKPQADMGKQTKVDVTTGSKKATGEKVGAVKPKSEKMTPGTKKQVTDNKADKPAEPTVEHAGSKPATGVGAVKPKADMGKQNVGDLNFDKYKTDHIKGPVLEAVEEKKDVVKEGEKIFGVPIEKTFKKKISKGFKEQKAAEKLTETNENVKKFIGFVESFKGQGQDDLIESVKTGFQSCFEERFGPGSGYMDNDEAAQLISKMFGIPVSKIDDITVYDKDGYVEFHVEGDKEYKKVPIKKNY